MNSLANRRLGATVRQTHAVRKLMWAPVFAHVACHSLNAQQTVVS